MIERVDGFIIIRYKIASYLFIRGVEGTLIIF